MKKPLICAFIIAAFSFVGCTAAQPHPENQDAEMPAVQDAVEVAMDLESITELMSINKEAALEKLGDNCEKSTMNSGKVLKYSYNDQNFDVYFADGLNPNNIDTIEFFGNVDVNGMRIGMTYDKAKGMMPNNYVECPKQHDGVQATLEFYEDGSIIRFFISNETNTVDKIRVMRFITVEQISKMIKMSKNDFIERFGEPDSIYPTGPENSCDGNYYGLLGLTFVFDDDSPKRNGSTGISWAASDKTGDRVITCGARLHMCSADIQNAIGTAPVYAGPVLVPPPGHFYGHMLIFNIDGINVVFESKDPYPVAYDEVFFSVSSIENLIPPVSPGNPAVFNGNDTAINGVKLGDTDNDILSISSQHMKAVEDVDSKTKRYSFDFGQIDLWQIPSGEYIVACITIKNDRCVGPRSTMVGMNSKDVVDRFHSRNDAYAFEHGVLYNYTSGDKGFIWHGSVNAEEVTSLEYQYVDQQNFLVNRLTFKITDGVVTTIEIGFAFKSQLEQMTENAFCP